MILHRVNVTYKWENVPRGWAQCLEDNKQSVS